MQGTWEGTQAQHAVLLAHEPLVPEAQACAEEIPASGTMDAAFGGGDWQLSCSTLQLLPERKARCKRESHQVRMSTRLNAVVRTSGLCTQRSVRCCRSALNLAPRT